jgi:hypothetical protein
VRIDTPAVPQAAPRALMIGKSISVWTTSLT